MIQSPLAFVFWHWPQGRVRRTEYERGLEAFQRSLRANGPEGLIEALSFSVRGLPWAGGGGPSWEDWYVVDDFRTLGELNEAAVAPPNRGPHDFVALEAAGAAGGLYKRLRGGLSLGEARFTTWLSKPPGEGYGPFLERVAELVGGREFDLWRRQLTLSPASEFCLHSRVGLVLPKGLSPLRVSVERVRVGEGRR